MVGLLYFLTNCAFAHAAESNFWQDRKKTAQLPSVPSLELLKGIPPSPSGASSTSAVSQELDKSLSSSLSATSMDLVRALSPAHGTLRSASMPSNAKKPKLIIHIQDVHQNAEAQENIGKALRGLIDRGTVGLVALEGAFGDIDLRGLRSFPHKDTVRAAADFLLKDQRIPGSIHTALVSEKEIPPLVGVDDEAHYNANVESYRRSVPRMAEDKIGWKSWAEGLAARKRSVFNPDLLAFDQDMDNYRAGRENLGAHVRKLIRAGNDVPAELGKFARALDLEEGLDFAQVERERAALVEGLVKRLQPAQADSLLRLSVAYRLGQVRYSDFYARLKDLCVRNDMSLAKYPAMDKYVRYVLAADTINASRLLGEISAAEKAEYSRLAKTPAEKELVRESRRAELAGKLLDFSLTPEEWKEYQQESISGSPIGDLSSYESFYREAHARDEAMARNLSNALEKHGARAAVLVTGGFHSQGIAARLKARGVAVVDYAPKITKVDAAAGSSYLSVFSQEKTPLEKMFEGERLFLSPKVWTPSIRAHQMALMASKESVRPDGLAPSDILPYVFGALEGFKVWIVKKAREVVVSIRHGETTTSITVDLDAEGEISGIREDQALPSPLSLDKAVPGLTLPKTYQAAAAKLAAWSKKDSVWNSLMARLYSGGILRLAEYQRTRGSLEGIQDDPGFQRYVQTRLSWRMEFFRHASVIVPVIGAIWFARQHKNQRFAATLRSALYSSILAWSAAGLLFVAFPQLRDISLAAQFVVLLIALLVLSAPSHEAVNVARPKAPLTLDDVKYDADFSEADIIRLVIGLAIFAHGGPLDVEGFAKKAGWFFNDFQKAVENKMIGITLRLLLKGYPHFLERFKLLAGGYRELSHVAERYERGLEESHWDKMQYSYIKWLSDVQQFLDDYKEFMSSKNQIPDHIKDDYDAHLSKNVFIFRRLGFNLDQIRIFLKLDPSESRPIVLDWYMSYNRNYMTKHHVGGGYNLPFAMPYVPFPEDEIKVYEFGSALWQNRDIDRLVQERIGSGDFNAANISKALAGIVRDCAPSELGEEDWTRAAFYRLLRKDADKDVLDEDQKTQYKVFLLWRLYPEALDFFLIKGSYPMLHTAIERVYSNAIDNTKKYALKSGRTDIDPKQITVSRKRLDNGWVRIIVSNPGVMDMDFFKLVEDPVTGRPVQKVTLLSHSRQDFHHSIGLKYAAMCIREMGGDISYKNDDWKQIVHCYIDMPPASVQEIGEYINSDQATLTLHKTYIGAVEKLESWSKKDTRWRRLMARVYSGGIQRLEQYRRMRGSLEGIQDDPGFQRYVQTRLSWRMEFFRHASIIVPVIGAIWFARQHKNQRFAATLRSALYSSILAWSAAAILLVVFPQLKDISLAAQFIVLSIALLVLSAPAHEIVNIFRPGAPLTLNGDGRSDEEILVGLEEAIDAGDVDQLRDIVAPWLGPAETYLKAQKRRNMTAEQLVITVGTNLAWAARNDKDSALASLSLFRDGNDFSALIQILSDIVLPGMMLEPISRREPLAPENIELLAEAEMPADERTALVNTILLWSMVNLNEQQALETLRQFHSKGLIRADSDILKQFFIRNPSLLVRLSLAPAQTGDALSKFAGNFLEDVFAAALETQEGELFDLALDCRQALLVFAVSDEVDLRRAAISKVESLSKRVWFLAPEKEGYYSAFYKLLDSKSWAEKWLQSEPWFPSAIAISFPDQTQLLNRLQKWSIIADLAQLMDRAFLIFWELQKTDQESIFSTDPDVRRMLGTLWAPSMEQRLLTVLRDNRQIRGMSSQDILRLMLRQDRELLRQPHSEPIGPHRFFTTWLVKNSLGDKKLQGRILEMLQGIASSDEAEVPVMVLLAHLSISRLPLSERGFYTYELDPSNPDEVVGNFLAEFVRANYNKGKLLVKLERVISDEMKRFNPWGDHYARIVFLNVLYPESGKLRETIDELLYTIDLLPKIEEKILPGKIRDYKARFLGEYGRDPEQEDISDYLATWALLHGLPIFSRCVGFASARSYFFSSLRGDDQKGKTAEMARDRALSAFPFSSLSDKVKNKEKTPAGPLFMAAKNTVQQAKKYWKQQRNDNARKDRSLLLIPWLGGRVYQFLRDRGLSDRWAVIWGTIAEQAVFTAVMSVFLISAWSALGVSPYSTDISQRLLVIGSAASAWYAGSRIFAAMHGDVLFRWFKRQGSDEWLIKRVDLKETTPERAHEIRRKLLWKSFALHGASFGIISLMALSGAASWAPRWAVDLMLLVSAVIPFLLHLDENLSGAMGFGGYLLLSGATKRDDRGPDELQQALEKLLPARDPFTISASADMQSYASAVYFELNPQSFYARINGLKNILDSLNPGGPVTEADLSPNDFYAFRERVVKALDGVSYGSFDLEQYLRDIDGDDRLSPLDKYLITGDANATPAQDDFAALTMTSVAERIDRLRNDPMFLEIKTNGDFDATLQEQFLNTFIQSYRKADEQTEFFRSWLMHYFRTALITLEYVDLLLTDADVHRREEAIRILRSTIHSLEESYAQLFQVSLLGERGALQPGDALPLKDSFTMDIGTWLASQNYEALANRLLLSREAAIQSRGMELLSLYLRSDPEASRFIVTHLESFPAIAGLFGYVSPAIVIQSILEEAEPLPAADRTGLIAAIEQLISGEAITAKADGDEAKRIIEKAKTLLAQRMDQENRFGPFDSERVYEYEPSRPVFFEKNRYAKDSLTPRLYWNNSPGEFAGDVFEQLEKEVTGSGDRKEGQVMAEYSVALAGAAALFILGVIANPALAVSLFIGISVGVFAVVTLKVKNSWREKFIGRAWRAWRLGLAVGAILAAAGSGEPAPLDAGIYQDLLGGQSVQSESAQLGRMDGRFVSLSALAQEDALRHPLFQTAMRWKMGKRYAGMSAVQVKEALLNYAAGAPQEMKSLSTQIRQTVKSAKQQSKTPVSVTAVPHGSESDILAVLEEVRAGHKGEDGRFQGYAVLVAEKDEDVARLSTLVAGDEGAIFILPKGESVFVGNGFNVKILDERMLSGESPRVVRELIGQGKAAVWRLIVPEKFDPIMDDLRADSPLKDAIIFWVKKIGGILRGIPMRLDQYKSLQTLIHILTQA